MDLIEWTKENGIKAYLKQTKMGVDMEIYHECWERGKSPFKGIKYWYELIERMILRIGADLECLKEGHEIEDCSYGGPDSGNMDHCCTRCGAYWSIPLY